MPVTFPAVITVLCSEFCVLRKSGSCEIHDLHICGQKFSLLFLGADLLRQFSVANAPAE